MVLAFATRPYGPNGPPTPETLSMVSGIISQGPRVHLTYPAAKVLRLIAAGLIRVAPGLPFPAPMPEEVRLFPLASICPEALMTGRGRCAQRFSHDPAVNERLANDPLRRPRGTVLGLHNMLTQVRRAWAGPTFD